MHILHDLDLKIEKQQLKKEVGEKYVVMKSYKKSLKKCCFCINSIFIFPQFFSSIDYLMFADNLY